MATETQPQGNTTRPAADSDNGFTPSPEVQRNARADSDRMSRSLVKDLPMGKQKPANQR